MPTNFVLWKWLEDVLEWLLDVLLWVPRKLFQNLLDGLATLIEAIPVPEFMTNLSSLAAGLDPGIAFFLSGINFGTGIGMMIAAYGIRFLIRRIPLVG